MTEEITKPEILPNNEPTSARIVRGLKRGWGGICKLWDWLPLSWRYAVVTTAAGTAATIAQNHGLLPPSITPERVVAGFAGIAFAHHIEDHGNATAPTP